MSPGDRVEVRLKRQPETWRRGTIVRRTENHYHVRINVLPSMVDLTTTRLALLGSDCCNGQHVTVWRDNIRPLSVLDVIAEALERADTTKV